MNNHFNSAFIKGHHAIITTKINGNGPRSFHVGLIAFQTDRSGFVVERDRMKYRILPDLFDTESGKDGARLYHAYLDDHPEHTQHRILANQQAYKIIRDFTRVTAPHRSLWCTYDDYSALQQYAVANGCGNELEGLEFIFPYDDHPAHPKNPYLDIKLNPSLGATKSTPMPRAQAILRDIQRARCSSE